MNKSHTYRITISLPLHLRDRLLERSPRRGVSKVVSTALENYFAQETLYQAPAQAFLKFGKKLSRRTPTQIKNAIEKGRQ